METYTLEYILGVLKIETASLSKENFISMLIKGTYHKSTEALGALTAECL